MDILDFITKWNADILAISNIAVGLGTLILAVGIPYAIRSAGREERDTFYATLDRTYFEIQKLVIEHPHLSQPDPAGKTTEQLIQYDAFALIVWNFLESVFDYSKERKNLAETWGCILRHEARVHGAWFRKSDNQLKFKSPFVRHIEQGGYLPPLHG